MIIDYSKYNKVNAIPEAASMIETFRAIGYCLETAIADIIDNSISAGAKNIYINRIWEGGKSLITIKDDGVGMSSEEIVHALRPGTQNPLSSREATDLGRFGLGLKTASFSQCRKLSVLSKTKDTPASYWSWDLDYVVSSNKWEVLQWIPDGFNKELDGVGSGTIIIWSDLDRLLPLETAETDGNAKLKFSNSMNKVKSHIAMTFHRFIEEKSVRIFWGDHEIEAWNPFCPSESKTQEQPTESITGDIKMKGYILPHKNNFSSESAYRKAEGMNGWGAHQGFYVYRGKRLLLAGDWLGMFRKEEHYKLVRIQIDLPNKQDTEWQIDIKKSKASPPMGCREQIESYAKAVRNIGAEVYKHRGKILKQRAGLSFQPLWLEKRKENKWSFIVNREHLMILNMKSLAKENPELAIETLLCFLEEAIPTKTIYINEAQGDEKQKLPFSDIDAGIMRKTIRIIFDNQIATGKTPDQAKAILMSTEPFNNYEDLINELYD